MPYFSLIISFGALVVAVTSVYLARRSWLDANRPLVTAAICTHQSGERGTALFILVTNSGNRPAREVRLSVEPGLIARHLRPGAKDGVVEGIERCFSDKGMIPVLRNGQDMRNSFGFLAGGQDTSTWNDEALLPINITYLDLDTERRFTNTVLVRIADNDAFARTNWKTNS